jgi:hypothetical protein
MYWCRITAFTADDEQPFELKSLKPRSLESTAARKIIEDFFSSIVKSDSAPRTKYLRCQEVWLRTSGSRIPEASGAPLVSETMTNPDSRNSRTKLGFGHWSVTLGLNLAAQVLPYKPCSDTVDLCDAGVRE